MQVMYFASLHILFLLLLSAGVSFAAPVVTFNDLFGHSAKISPNGTIEILDRRGTGTPVCGINSRGAVRDKCKINNLQFTWNTNTNVLSAVTRTGEPADSTAECDHALELQFLARTFEAPNGVCSALTGIADALGLSKDSKLSDFKKEMLQPLFDAINGKTNTVFLPKVINGVKKNVVAAFLYDRDHPAASPEVNAVHAYYQNNVVRDSTKALAAELDKLAREMIMQRAAQSSFVTAALAKLSDSTTKSRPTSPRAAANKAMNDAVTAWSNGNAATVTARWNAFLNWV